MTLSLVEWHELHEIAKKVRRADPRLASALALFSALASSEPLPRHERLGSRLWRLRAIPLIMAAAAGLAVRRTGALVRRIAAMVHRIAAMVHRIAAMVRRIAGRAGRATLRVTAAHPRSHP